MTQFELTICISVIIVIIIAYLQFKCFFETKHYTKLYRDFFRKDSDFKTDYENDGDDNEITKLVPIGAEYSDLNTMIKEINHYISKTKGTTDFAIIQNKVERKVQMRYDQATAKMTFPIYLGLMGTFIGVLIGILTFLWGFNDSEVTNESVQNLLTGVLVSMLTSLVGLILTTIRTGAIGDARKRMEEDKNDFYDFVQTELMPSLDSGLITAVAHLHRTLDKFAPSFNQVIGNFESTFDRCTSAFGDSFEKNVKVVANAVLTMGKNMDKINENVRQQRLILDTIKSNKIARGLEKYIEAAEHFAGITQSLDKFEEARRMMLAATQEVINYQYQYNEMLSVPREVAVRINQILDRIVTFEENVNRIGEELALRDMTSSRQIEAIDELLKALKKKEAIADKFLQIGDDKLEELYKKQVAVINDMNSHYAVAIQNNIYEFEEMMKRQLAEIDDFHIMFKESLERKFNIEDVRKEFSQLSKLEQLPVILSTLKQQTDNIISELKTKTDNDDPVKTAELSPRLEEISKLLTKIEEKRVKLF